MLFERIEFILLAILKFMKRQK